MLALYALLAATVVPTMAPVPVGDDWVYARSVEILLREGTLRVLDLSVVTLLFQVGWGVLFAAVFGEGFGALRLSTVTLVAVSGLACHGLCRELGVGRGRSAFGAAVYLFNPLAFVLAFSFMTDPHFAALLTISSLGYVRGLRPGAPDRVGRWALAGGAVAVGAAFLVRQQGALIPLAVVLALLFARRLPPDRRGLALSVRVAAVPALAVVGYYLWLSLVHGVPEWQSSFFRTVREAGWDESRLLGQRMLVVELMYLGLFALPLVAAALPALGQLASSPSEVGWIAVAAWTGAVVAGLFAFLSLGRDIPPMPLMPYVPQYLGPTGLGPNDLYGGRRWLVGWGTLEWLTAVCAVSSVIFALAVCRHLGRSGAAGMAGRTRPDATRAGAGIVASILVWQGVGVLPPSFHFRDWILSVDRYLLPLLPLALCLGLWALRDARLAMPVAWVAVAALGAFAVAGTRDFLVFQRATWELARSATAIGIPVQRLDAGASWDGYHLYEYSRANGIPPQTPGGPWWTDLFAPAIESTYVVSTVPLLGYQVVAQVGYSTWLEDDPSELFLQRRHGAPGPP
ncbi:MAG: hypothetical protein M3Q10_06480 [Chloroflexota bacterium]|nr:hypothetical protein [Chloroflexota bacterium]